VLLVEDDEVLRALLAEDLKDRGIEVREAGGVAAALEVFDSDPDAIAALVMDLDLGPGQPNGKALAQEARRRRPRLMVVFVTGYPRWMTRCGRDEQVLTKPFPPDELEALLRKVVA
jgi:DNA-binding response OmpR family regulator